MRTMKKKPLYSDVESDRVRKIKHAAVAVDTLILKSLGFENINTNGVQQSCPVHGGDRPDAFCYGLVLAIDVTNNTVMILLAWLWA